MTSASYYTIAGVEDNYAVISNLEMAIGDFLTEENNESKEKVCVLGATVAKEIFGSAYDAYDGIVYIDGRPYIVSGVLSEMGTVASVRIRRSIYLTKPASNTLPVRISVQPSRSLRRM